MTVRATMGDFWGGLAAMLVALPSSIAFGVVVYGALGPQHVAQGALAGMVGAAVLGTIAPLVGRNGGFVTAPCAPAAAVMSALAADLAARGVAPERAVAEMALAALLSAVLQLVYGALRAGRLIKYIPYQVVSGYLSGVALIIAAGQIPRLLGLPLETSLRAAVSSPSLWAGPAMAVGVVTILVMAGARRVTQRVPAAILGLLGGGATYLALTPLRPELLRTADNPLIVGSVALAGSFWELVTSHAMRLVSSWPTDSGPILSTALTLSILLSIDTLKTGVVLDALALRRHDSNRELLGQGVANVASALAGGLPGAGTMGATLVNFTSGGRNPLSGVVSGLLALVVLALLSPLVAFVPVAALAGVLLVVSWKMFDFSVFRLLLRPSTRLDFAVIATVVVVAEAVGLIQASLVGVVLAVLLFIRDQIHSDVILGCSDLRQTSSKRRRRPVERELLDHHGGQGLLVRLQGNLFFGTTDQVYGELEAEVATRRFLLLDLRRVQSLDYTAGQLFHQMQHRLKEGAGQLLFSGMPSGVRRGLDIEGYMEELGLVREQGGIRVFETRDAALEWMEDQILSGVGYVFSDEEAPVEPSGIEIFRDLDARALEILGEALETRSVAQGGRIFSKGDTTRELMLVRRGRVHVMVPLPGGLQHHLATLCRGDFLGEMAFLDQRERSANAVAATPVDLYVLPRERFDRLATGNQQLAARVFESLARAVSLRLRSADAELRSLEER